MNHIKNNITSYLDFFCVYENNNLINQIISKYINENTNNNNDIIDESTNNNNNNNNDIINDIFGYITDDSDFENNLVNEIEEELNSLSSIEIDLELGESESTDYIFDLPDPPKTAPPSPQLTPLANDTFNLPDPLNTTPPSLTNLSHMKLNSKNNISYYSKLKSPILFNKESIPPFIPSMKSEPLPAIKLPKIGRKNTMIYKSYINKKKKTTFSCPLCSLSFYLEINLNEHYVDYHTNNNNNIPTSEFGQNICPICDNKYLTQEMLGEHFINDHNDYNELCNLDKNNSIGYPGFNILEYIGMVSQLSEKNIIKLINKQETCNICYSQYKIIEKSYNNLLKNIYKLNNNGYNSDSEILDIRNKFLLKKKNINNKTLYITKNIFNNRKIGIESRIITHHKLLEIINKYKDIEFKPIKINCCNTTLCKKCFEEYIKISNKLICPFCKYDHTVKEKYIYYYKDLDICNKDIWIEWWKKHLDIFL
jgi:hypothetical protein